MIIGTKFCFLFIQYLFEKYQQEGTKEIEEEQTWDEKFTRFVQHEMIFSYEGCASCN